MPNGCNDARWSMTRGRACWGQKTKNKTKKKVCGIHVCLYVRICMYVFFLRGALWTVATSTYLLFQIKVYDEFSMTFHFLFSTWYLVRGYLLFAMCCWEVVRGGLVFFTTWLSRFSEWKSLLYQQLKQDIPSLLERSQKMILKSSKFNGEMQKTCEVF